MKQTGAGRWICKCPAHDDKHPSCNVRELPDGKVLVVCRAGCSNADIIAATGLHWSALYPAQDNTYADYKREARRIPASDVLEALSFEALLVAIAAQNIAGGVELSNEDRARVMVAAERIMTARTMTNG